MYSSTTHDRRASNLCGEKGDAKCDERSMECVNTLDMKKRVEINDDIWHNTKFMIVSGATISKETTYVLT